MCIDYLPGGIPVPLRKLRRSLTMRVFWSFYHECKRTFVPEGQIFLVLGSSKTDNKKIWEIAVVHPDDSWPIQHNDSLHLIEEYSTLYLKLINPTHYFKHYRMVSASASMYIRQQPCMRGIFINFSRLSYCSIIYFSVFVHDMIYACLT